MASADTFLSGANAQYVAELYARFTENPKTVDQTWQDYFSALDDEEREILVDLTGASWSASDTGVVGQFSSCGLMEADAGPKSEQAQV